MTYFVEVEESFFDLIHSEQVAVFFMDDFDVFWLSGAQTQGVVMCNQPRTVDLLARQSQFIEALPNEVIDEVLAKLQAIYEKTFARQPVDFTVKILYNSFIINNLQVNP